MEAVIRDDVSGKEATHEVSETATAGELLEEACRLFEREVLDSALEVDGAVVCTGVVGGVSGGEVSVGSLGVHSGSKLMLCRSRDRVLALAAGWEAEWGEWGAGEECFPGIDEDSLPEWAWDDEVVALALAKADVDAFAFVSERLKTNDAFMRDVVERNGCALKYASAELRSNRELVLAAVSQDGWALQGASEELRADKEIVLAAVSQDGWALQGASEELRADKEIVLTAVAKVGAAVTFASEELMADDEVVAAVDFQFE